MDTIGLYEVEELSLFSGDQLLEWGSSLEPDWPPPFTIRGHDIASELLDHTESNYDAVKASSFNFTSNHTSQDYNSGLENGWLDTRLDLFNLLHDTEPEASELTFESYLQHQTIETADDVVVPTISFLPKAESNLNLVSLLNQMSGNANEPELDSDQLSEVLTKLTNYISDDAVEITDNSFDTVHIQDLLSPVVHIPDLSNGMLSPVSVEDLESLLSVSDVVEDGLQNDSGLDSLASSRPDSPSFSVNSDVDYRPSTSSGKQKRQKNIRRSPYDSLPLDRKERKKIQNKTAALKYREKKKGETVQVKESVESLETRNKELKQKVESMTGEIQYLKNLMADILKARGHL